MYQYLDKAEIEWQLYMQALSAVMKYFELTYGRLNNKYKFYFFFFKNFNCTVARSLRPMIDTLKLPEQLYTYKGLAWKRISAPFNLKLWSDSIKEVMDII